MSTTRTQTLPIAPAESGSVHEYSQRLAQKPRTVDVMKNARLARSMYQRELLRQFMKFLVSCRPFARLGSILDRTERRVEASARN